MTYIFNKRLDGGASVVNIGGLSDDDDLALASFWHIDANIESLLQLLDVRASLTDDSGVLAWIDVHSVMNASWVGERAVSVLDQTVERADGTLNIRWKTGDLNADRRAGVLLWNGDLGLSSHLQHVELLGLVAHQHADQSRIEIDGLGQWLLHN